VPQRNSASQVAPSAGSRLLDELREGFGIESDKALAAWLGIEPSTLSVVRTGRHGFGQVQRLKVLDRISFLRTRRLLESLLPDRLAQELVAWSQRNATGQARRALARLDLTDGNAGLIEVAKIAFEYDTDDKLAEFLGVSRSALSMVRRGRVGLGDRPKLRILKRIAPDAGFEEIERALDSTDYMIELVRRWRHGGGNPSQLPR
jgi:transcriptional regulator with XRE-family HTH domain